MKKKRKVAIIGAGVAGLSAAHELIERDFEVTVYDRSRILGGKARSVEVRQTATDGRLPLPGEHGFRFFPGWYRNLPDTLSRIPYAKTGKSVKENLVSAETNLLLADGHDPIRAIVSFPLSWERLKLAFKVPREVAELVPAEDLEFFVRKMSQFVVSCEERRRQEVEPQSWWEFMEADKRSREFQLYLVKGATQNSVAARAETASAYTIARLVIQTVLDVMVPGSSADHVLNGPTQEVWIDPWRTYLEQQGVEFKLGFEFDDFIWEDPEDLRRPRDEIKFARLTPVRDELKLAESRWITIGFLTSLVRLNDPNELDLQRLYDRAVATLDVQFTPEDAAKIREFEKRLQSFVTRRQPPDATECEELARDAGKVQAELLEQYEHLEQLSSPDRSLQEFRDLPDLEQLWVDRAISNAGFLRAVAEVAERTGAFAPLTLRRKLLKEGPNSKGTIGDLDMLFAVVEGLRKRGLGYELARADYFVLALPVEQTAFYVNRSPTLLKKDARLANIVRLSEHVEWMVGIQFYLNVNLELTRGHVDFLDSEWALTAISQLQFWDDVDIKEHGDGKCRGILSVDISSWYTPGKLTSKPAWDCSAEEIADEVWYQIKHALNRPGQPVVLSDTHLVGGKLSRNQSYFLDDSLVERFDRKKQALFEKFRRVAFDGGVLTERQYETRRASDAPEAFGSRLSINAEPLLVNRAGALNLRPEAKTAIPNLFLAGDYVSTSTNLACMEGANEAARRAVNALLKVAHTKDEPCEVWELSEPLESLRALDKKLFEMGQRLDVFTGLPLDVAGATTRAATGVADKAWKFFKNRW